MNLRAEACEQSLGAAEVLGGGELIDERGGALARPCNPRARRGARRAPTPDGDAEREQGGDPHTPAERGTNHDDSALTRRAPPRCDATAPRAASRADDDSPAPPAAAARPIDRRS